MNLQFDLTYYRFQAPILSCFVFLTQAQAQTANILAHYQPCSKMSNFNTTKISPDAAQWQPDGDTLLTIFFGTMGVLFAGIQVVLGWIGVRALQARH